MVYRKFDFWGGRSVVWQLVGKGFVKKCAKNSDGALGEKPLPIIAEADREAQPSCLLRHLQRALQRSV
eukprot:958906-Amphidinium_carterae.1